MQPGTHTHTHTCHGEVGGEIHASYYGNGGQSPAALYRHACLAARLRAGRGGETGGGERRPREGRAARPAPAPAPGAGSGERGARPGRVPVARRRRQHPGQRPAPGAPAPAPHPGREHPWVLPPNFCPSAAAVPRMHRHPDTPTHGHPDTPTHGHTDTPTSRHADIPTHGHTDSPTPPPPRHTPPGARSLSVPVLVQPGGQPRWGEASPACSPPPAAPRRRPVPVRAVPGRAVPVPVGRPLPGRPEQAPAAPRAPRAGALAAGRRLWAGRWCPLSSAPLQRKEKNRSSRAHPLSHTEGSGIFSPSLISSPVRLASEQGSVTRSTQPLQGGVCLSSPPGSLFITRWPQLARAKARDGASKATPTTLGGLEMAKCAELPRRHCFAIQTNTRIFTHTYICIYMYTKRYCIGINHL